MNLLWSELKLSFCRLFRRKVHTNLLLITFAVSVTLSALSWTLFHTVHLSHPTFDQRGEYLVLANKNRYAVNPGQPGYQEMVSYKANQTVFSDWAEMSVYNSVFIETPNGNERVHGAYLSSRALQIMGAKPLLGSLFTPADDVHDTLPKILLSERLWTNSFGRDPDVLGKQMTVIRYQGIIVGVLPKNFRLPNDQDLWISYGGYHFDDEYSNRTALVKLKPGISPERAVEDLETIHSSFPANSISKRRELTPGLGTFRDAFLLPDLKTSSLILMALSLLFLAVSCVNAANLMLVDFLGRRPELAASLAVGVTRAGIARSLCWQVGMIALLSAGIAACLIPFIAPFLYDRIQIINAPFWLVYAFQWRDVGMTFLFSGIAAAVTVVVPIIYLYFVNADQVIREHSSSYRGTGRALWRRLLLTGQIAILTVLGIVTALLVRSNQNVGESHWGFDASAIFNGKVSIGAIRYAEGEWATGRIASFHKAFLGIRKRPETAAASYMGNASGYNNGPYCSYATSQEALVNGAAAGKAFFSDISDQHFATLGVSFVEGEDFEEALSPIDNQEVIITESLAHKLWPGESALQRRLYVFYSWMKKGEPPREKIVRGVVRDYQVCGPRAESNDGIFTHWRLNSGAYMNGAHIYVRDKAGIATPKSLSDAIHREVPKAALYFPTTLKERIDLLLNSMRMTSDLSIVFAISAVILCAIGVYSLTITQVLQSSREFGIRMALGAEPTKLWWLFSRMHLLNTLIGVGLGIVGATQLMRVLKSLLFGVDPYAPSTYLIVAVLILIVAALACLPSLARLKKISPSDCLRSL